LLIVKLKIDHNCLRLRLTADDLRELAAEGGIAETTNIGGASLTYALEPGTGPGVTADLIDTRINVVVPGEMLERWANSDQITIEASQPPLRILIEKDLGRGRS
jgi:hypothetical protein